MKATIRDAETLRVLPPLGVASYLRSKGWYQSDVIGRRGSVWSSRRPGLEGYEILLPLSRELGDYVTRMAEMIGTLEVAEGRPQTQILEDIADATADVVRIQIEGPVAQDGTLPIDEGVEAFERARDLMLAAACAAVRPRAVYHTRRPTLAMEYMTRLRLGQTSHGSFVMTVRSPVAPALHAANQPPALDAEQPFEREVTKTLARALAATRDASNAAIATADFAPFPAAVDQGVSANLCEAIVGLSRQTRAENVTVSVAWSPSREIAEQLPSRFRFSVDAVAVIAEAARIFRDRAPREEFELHGVVVGLQRPEGAPAGIVKVAAIVDGILRNVRLELAGDDYSHATRAHEAERRVACLGDLVREGRLLVLKNPHGFEVEPVEPDEVAP